MYKYILVLIVFSLPLAIIHSQSNDLLNQVIHEYEIEREAQSHVNKMRWPDYSDNKVNKDLDKINRWLSQLKDINPKELDESSIINLEMLRLILEDQKYNLEFQSYLLPLTSEGGFLTGMVYATSYLHLSDESSKSDYLTKLESSPAYLNQQTRLLQKGVEENKILPKLIVEKCIGILEQQLDSDPDNHYLAKALTKDIKQEGVSIIREKIYPAFSTFKDYLQDDYLEKARESIGISEVENGKEYYEQRVSYFTTLDMSPKEVFDTGQAEVKRIKSEMMDIIKELEFEGTYADFLDFLRTDPQFYPKTPEELLHRAAWISKKSEEQLPKYFSNLPRMPFTVNPVPAAIAENYTAGRYSGGSWENQKPGEYWVNTTKLNSRPLYSLPALTLHEAVPGHHLQIMLADEIEDVPKFRNDTYLSAYGEGWGLYAEFWGKEAGLYTSLYEDFGRMTYEMWRAVRLVVDPGMHYFGWSREEAVRFMAENTALSLHEVNTEIDRYIGWPGQAVSYKIGELKIRELRKMAEERLDDKFDIRTFHDAILKNGSVPLKTLESIIVDYINDEIGK